MPWERTHTDHFAGKIFCGVDIGRKKDLTVLWVLELEKLVLRRWLPTAQGTDSTAPTV